MASVLWVGSSQGWFLHRHIPSEWVGVRPKCGLGRHNGKNSMRIIRSKQIRPMGTQLPPRVFRPRFGPTRMATQEAGATGRNGQLSGAADLGTERKRPKCSLQAARKAKAKPQATGTSPTVLALHTQRRMTPPYSSATSDFDATSPGSPTATAMPPKGHCNDTQHGGKGLDGGKPPESCSRLPWNRFQGFFRV